MSYPPKGRADYQKPGTWNARCSMCFAKRKADEMVRNWQGMYRCKEHDETRHPQDFVRTVQDNPSVPWSQPGGTTFVTLCDVFGITSVAGYAVAGCSVCNTPLSIAGY